MKIIWCVLVGAIIASACNRGSGCPAQEQMSQNAQDPTKSKKIETRSSVEPGLVKYSSKKKKK
jgi:hypothetical protein